MSRDDWHRIAAAHARIMWAAGIRPSDTIFLGSFFGLYWGGWGALIGGERLGATCFPFGAGVPGQTQQAVEWLPVTPALAHLFTDKQGFGWLSEDDFVHHFAADVEPVRARVMHAVQQPLATSVLGDVMGVPAWKTLPSWYLVATDDEAIPPAAERQFADRMGATTVEIPSSHLPMVSHPDDVAQLIEAAAEAVLATS
jgi:pimeloyl-ACP methyl ester carboxylesterase